MKKFFKGLDWFLWKIAFPIAFLFSGLYGVHLMLIQLFNGDVMNVLVNNTQHESFEQVVFTIAVSLSIMAISPFLLFRLLKKLLEIDVLKLFKRRVKQHGNL